ncbi:MAG: hypothetical protein KDB80_12545 [Planctomycetes bacterium]|nr:hypothetical protein [Planctomycetota bacterium]
MRPLLCTIVLGLICASPALTQIDPKDNIKKILETIDEELKEIDRLLLRPNAPDASSRSTEQMRKRVQESHGSQERVVRGIDELIQQLQQMQSGQGGSSQEDEQQRQQQGQPEDQEQTQRQENQTQAPPSDAPQPGQQGQENPQDRPTPTQNSQTGQLPESGEERHVREADRARWGNLPLYDLGRHSRGGLPEVPEKYRRLLEAYQKANQKVRRDPR